MYAPSLYMLLIQVTNYGMAYSVKIAAVLATLWDEKNEDSHTYHGKYSNSSASNTYSPHNCG